MVVESQRNVPGTEIAKKYWMRSYKKLELTYEIDLSFGRISFLKLSDRSQNIVKTFLFIKKVNYATCSSLSTRKFSFQ